MIQRLYPIADNIDGLWYDSAMPSTYVLYAYIDDVVLNETDTISSGNATPDLCNFIWTPPIIRSGKISKVVFSAWVMWSYTGWIQGHSFRMCLPDEKWKTSIFPLVEFVKRWCVVEAYTNPKTGNEWTWVDIANLKAGFHASGSDNSFLKGYVDKVAVYQTFIDVYYDDPLYDDEFLNWYTEAVASGFIPYSRIW